jgi:hypothetical protein
MKSFYIQLLVFYLAVAGAPVVAQGNPTDIIRVCAPSTNIAAKLEGSVGNVITKRLLGAEASGSVEVFEDGELLKLLIEADPDNATVIYKMYLDCVKPEVDKYIEANVVSGPVSIQPGTAFELQTGTTVDLLSGKYLFTVTGIRRNGSGQFHRLQTTLTGLEGRKSQLDFGDSIGLHKSNCRLGFTGMSSDEKVFRFQLNCA